MILDAKKLLFSNSFELSCERSKHRNVFSAIFVTSASVIAFEFSFSATVPEIFVPHTHPEMRLTC